MRLARPYLHALRRTGLWRDDDYVKFWSAQSISAVGSQVSLLAIPLLAAISLGADSIQMGFLVAAGTAPILFLSSLEYGPIDCVGAQSLSLPILAEPRCCCSFPWPGGSIVSGWNSSTSSRFWVDRCRSSLTLRGSRMFPP